jgi:hypothetical protein
VRGFLCIIALAAAALPGCGAPVGTAVVVGVMAADAAHYYTIGPDGKAPMYRAPAPDPSRSINVQDCTAPVDYNGGNLLCR